MLATVKKIGGSVAIVIPKSMAAQNQLSPGASVDLSQGEDGIIVRRPRGNVRRSINDIVKEIDSAAYARRRQELALDHPLGKEIW